MQSELCVRTKVDGYCIDTQSPCMEHGGAASSACAMRCAFNMVDGRVNLKRAEQRRNRD